MAVRRSSGRRPRHASEEACLARQSGDVRPVGWCLLDHRRRKPGLVSIPRRPAGRRLLWSHNRPADSVEPWQVARGPMENSLAGVLHWRRNFDHVASLATWRRRTLGVRPGFRSATILERCGRNHLVWMACDHSLRALRDFLKRDAGSCQRTVKRTGWSSMALGRVCQDETPDHF